LVALLVGMVRNRTRRSRDDYSRPGAEVRHVLPVFCRR
jgi:hypothetical protein